MRNFRVAEFDRVVRRELFAADFKELRRRDAIAREITVQRV